MKKPPLTDGPFERLTQVGIRSAPAFDLLALALGKDAQDARNLEPTAQALMKRFGINLLGDLGRSDLQELAGLTDYDSVRVLAAIEIGRRSGISGKGELKEIKGPSDVFKVFSYLRDEKKEHFCALILDSKNGILGVRTIHIGTLNYSVAHPRELFREAIREGAASVIVVHNHPSGNPEPSEDDINLTRRMIAAGDLLGIPVRDHVIIGHNDFASLKKLGHMGE